MPVEYIAGVQLLLYGLGWAVAAVLIREQRRVLLHWSAYGLAHAASVVLSTQALATGAFPPGAALVCSLLGFGFIVRGIDVFASNRARLDRWTFGVLVLSFAVIAAAEMVEPVRALAMRRLAYQGGVAALLLGSAPLLWRRLRPDYGRLTTAVALTSGIVYGALALVAMALHLLLGAREMAEVRQASHVPNVVGSLVISALFNFGYLFLLISRLIGRLRYSSAHDHLTGCFNRRAIESWLNQAWLHHQRTQGGLCVALIDIDHFKRINDEYGHAVGDQALAFAATTLREHTRAGDAIGRWGGEEFLVVMPGTDRDTALAVGERLRCVLEAGSRDGVGFVMTASVGIAFADGHGDPPSLSVLVARADRAMYLAKRDGRNRVAQAGPEADVAPAPPLHAPSPKPEGVVTC